MPEFLSLFFLVIALCADAFTASFVYGADRVKIPFVSAAIITLLSAGILAAFLFAGEIIRPFLPSSSTSILCAVLLFFLGVSKITACPVRDVAIHANHTEPEILSPKEALFLGIALSLDSAAAGIGTGLTGASYPLLIGLALITGFLAITGGCRLGRAVSAKTNVDFSKAGGMILMILALLKLV